MDLDEIRTALATPLPPMGPEVSGLVAALDEFNAASRRHDIAEAEANRSRRPSTLKASLKSTMALELARRHVIAELRLVCSLPEPRPDSDTLRLCS